jgi:hypothetical protein
MSRGAPRILPEFTRQFAAVEARLRAQLEGVRSQLRHPGNKGSRAEGAFRQALSEYLPKAFSFGHGEIIDTHGGRSAQTDLVIATDFHPNWFNESDPSLFLIEGVAAVGEIKTVITSQNLAETLKNVSTFRALQPDWGGHTEVVANESDAKRFYRSPPYILFAYESQVSLEGICTTVEAATGDERGLESLDGVFVLGSGSVLNYGDGSGSFVCQGPSGDSLSGYYWDDEQSPLLMLMRWLPTALALPVVQIPVLPRYILSSVPSPASGSDAP